jgi:methyl-accepting chemotaxis protein
MQNLTFQQRIFLLFSICVFLIISITTAINYYNFKTDFEHSEYNSAESVVLSAKSAMVEVMLQQQNGDATKLNLRKTLAKLDGVKEKSQRLQIIESSEYYKSLPCRVGLSVGQSAGSNRDYKVKFNMINARFAKEDAKGFAKESILKARENGKEFHFRIDWNNETIEGFLAVPVMDCALSRYGTKENDPDGNGYDELGFKMEGYKMGEYHYGYYITKSVSKDLSASFNEFLTTILVQIAISVISLVSIIFILKYTVIKKMENSIHYIVSSSNQILQASSQIESSATSLSQIATEQSSSIQTVTDNVADTTSHNNDNSQKSQEATEYSSSANKSANEGFELVKELSVSMDEINDSSASIANIIKTIDEIAFQTNLLALNAAVEAARAGEHGLGFAVVAEEVRSLANRSAEAAGETSSIIEKSIEQVDKGNKITQKANEAFKDILQKSEGTKELIDSIARAIKEQNIAMNDINESVYSVDMGIQSLSSSSEELAASSEELTKQAQAMTNNIKEIAKLIGYKGE